MDDSRTEKRLSAWLRGTAIAAPQDDRTIRNVVARVDTVAQRPSPRLAGPLALSSFRVAIAAVVAVLVAGALGLALALGTPSGPVRPAPGAGGGEPGGVHWASGVVDLRAESVTLRIGDDVYTTEDADVVVDSSGYKGQFGLYPRWEEDGRTLWLYLDFVSNDRSWAVEAWLWTDGVYHPGDAVSAAVRGASPGDQSEYIPQVFGESVEFDGADRIRMPLGQSYAGDWRLRDTIRLPVCGSEAPKKVQVSLTFEDMELTVTPRPASFLEQIGDDYFHRGSMLGDIFRGSLDRPEVRPLECQEP